MRSSRAVTRRTERERPGGSSAESSAAEGSAAKGSAAGATALVRQKNGLTRRLLPEAEMPGLAAWWLLAAAVAAGLALAGAFPPVGAWPLAIAHGLLAGRELVVKDDGVRTCYKDPVIGPIACHMDIVTIRIERA